MLNTYEKILERIVEKKKLERVIRNSNIKRAEKLMAAHSVEVGFILATDKEEIVEPIFNNPTGDFYDTPIGVAIEAMATSSDPFNRDLAKEVNDRYWSFTEKVFNTSLESDEDIELMFD